MIRKIIPKNDRKLIRLVTKKRRHKNEKKQWTNIKKTTGKIMRQILRKILRQEPRNTAAAWDDQAPDTREVKQAGKPKVAQKRKKTKKAKKVGEGKMEDEIKKTDEVVKKSKKVTKCTEYVIPVATQIFVKASSGKTITLDVEAFQFDFNSDSYVFLFVFNCWWF